MKYVVAIKYEALAGNVLEAVSIVEAANAGEACNEKTSGIAMVTSWIEVRAYELGPLLARFGRSIVLQALTIENDDDEAAA